MAVSDSGLSALIKSELQAALGTILDDSLLAAFCDAIAKAVNQHYKENAQILPGTMNVSGAPVAGTGKLS